MKNMLAAVKEWVHSSKCFFDMVMVIVVLAELVGALTAWNGGNMCFLAAHIIIAIVIVTAYAMVHRKQISEA